MATSARTEAFQKLKPVCTALSKICMQNKEEKVDIRHLVLATENVLQAVRDVWYFDSKLADYVFFPLSYIFREYGSFPGTCVEQALACLQLLISKGWKDDVGDELCKQLLVLFAFFSGGGVERNALSEDTSIAALRCLECLFKTALSSVRSLCATQDTQEFAVVGHCLSIQLEILAESGSHQVQLAAAQSLSLMMDCLGTGEAMRSFLPGIVSKLVSILHPGSQRRSYKVVDIVLQTFSTATRNTFGNKSSASSASWQQRSAIYVRMALTKVVKLRHHGRLEVLQSLFRLCTMLIEECGTTLADCMSTALETLVIVQDQEIFEETIDRRAFKFALQVQNVMRTQLEACLHSWLQSLPDKTRYESMENRRRFAKLAFATYNLLFDSGQDMTYLDKLLSEVILQVLDTAFEVETSHTKGGKQISEMPTTSEVALLSHEVAKFPIIMTPTALGSAILAEYEELLCETAKSEMLITLQTYASMSALKHTPGGQLTARIWLFLKCGQALRLRDMRDDEYVQLGNDHAANDERSDGLYVQCIDTLLSSPLDEHCTHSSQAVALELIAFRSQCWGIEFRPNLVDALYPVIERAASSNLVLRAHAITSLKVITTSCGYKNVGDLIMGNADYLVNALALRFNTFDISHQAPQILLLMLEVCGPALIPYLDDLVESIFVALDTYHGYTMLVESLFAVLGSIVNQGAKSSKRALLSGSKSDHPPQHRVGISETQHLLSVNLARREQELQMDETHLVESTNEEPILSTSEAVVHKDSDKIYEMVEAIVRVGQHYLTHESAIVRQNILVLTSKSCGVLSEVEDKFLPVLNDVWPVLINRLFDPEPIVASAAADSLAMLFEHAGSFLLTRVEDEWTKIAQLYRRTIRMLSVENRGTGGLGLFTNIRVLHESLIRMATSLIWHLRPSGGIEDDLLEFLSPFAEARPILMAAMDQLNADASWLEGVRSTSGQQNLWEPPTSMFPFQALVL